MMAAVSAVENPSDCKDQGEEPPSKRPSLVKDLSYLQAERPKKRQSDSEATTADKRPRKRLSLSKKDRRRKVSDTRANEDSNTRFSFHSSPEVNKYKEKIVPKATLRSTKWALEVFDEWVKARKNAGKTSTPDDVLCGPDAKVVCEWLCRFFSEVRKTDGNPYCPRSLSSLLAGLHRHVQSISPYSLKIQDSEGDFKPLHVLLENLYRELHEQGIGAVKAQARVITLEEEAKLWATGAIGVETPSSLVNAVFYLNGINFTLRGGGEHRDLCLSQFQFGSENDPDNPDKTIDYVDYTEFGSKKLSRWKEAA